MRGAPWLAAVALAILLVAGCTQRTPTFSEHIAPILYSNCAECHRPGGPGPFSVLTYADVKRRARQIADVTSRRYMPPWLPEPGYGDFEGARRLRDDQIEMIRQWVEAGAPEGDPGALPPAPPVRRGWQLGEPDLVVRLEQPYVVPPGDRDVFRNFILPLAVTGERYVRAVEIMPGTHHVVHHANLIVDRGGAARERDAADPEPGFEGMDIEAEFDSFEPDSHFLFWKAGSPPAVEPPDMAWRLDAETDLVLNMHLQPADRPAPVQPAVGLYFTDQPPSRFPMLLQLEHDGALDIAPGVREFVVTDEYTLPVDVEVLGVYPHAHYLGKDLRGFATLPDGTRRWLIWIKDWDFNWQAVYRYRQPVFLPRGSTLAMRFTYDNSADNPRNPSTPPRRVRAGNQSTDEMAHLWVQVLPRRPEDRMALQEALMRRRLEKYPGDFVALVNLGAVLQALGRLDEAIAHLRTAVRVRPGDARALNNLGAALQASGRLDEAASAFRRALSADPDYLHAHYNLGNTLLALNRSAEATAHFRRVLRERPDDADAHNELGSALAIGGKLEEAISHFQRAVALAPDHRYAHANLARAFALQGRFAEAVTHYEHAVRLDPNDREARDALAQLSAELRRRRR